MHPPRLRLSMPSLVALFLAVTRVGITPPATAAAPLVFTVTPAATGPQLVRTSLPFPPGLLPTNSIPEITAISSTATSTVAIAALRVLSLHPVEPPTPPTIRRGLISFLHTFRDSSPVRFELQPSPTDAPADVPDRLADLNDFPVTCSLAPEGVQLRWTNGTALDLTLVAPGLAPRGNGTTNPPPRLEEVEHHPLFRWQRLHVPDPDWPRVIEIRLDRQGTVSVTAHLQRGLTNGVFAPDFGWDIRPQGVMPMEFASPSSATRQPATKHDFASGLEATVRMGTSLELRAPTGAASRRGLLEIASDGANPGPSVCRYRRCLSAESVPMQWMAWRRADLTFSRPGVAPLTPTLSSPHHVAVDSRLWATLYGMPAAPQGLPQELDSLLRYHRFAIARSAAQGDDLGNITSFNDGQEHGGAFGMNRLNHGAAIFEDAWRSSDARLRETAVQWCDNFHDLSIWWGAKERGGTRYNNIVAQNRTPPTKDFMWRSDSSVNFCTKGYDGFWLAWEETGDPRMREALDAQLDYASRHLHANVECRNIGDVRDFIRLYQFTGEQRHLNEALRLFRELRAKLSTGNLFDQGGKPIDPNPPFINDDQAGLKLGYAKPYIIGYALNGLPDLLRYAPNEPELRPTIRAVADFLAGSVDPVGGWRYPHPRSTDTLVSQGIEHAWQLTQAARALGPEPAWLDAIETVLRARIHAWRRAGRILSGLGGWELATGHVKSAADVSPLYARPSDRDPSRDYTEGPVGLGSAPPEGLVYFSDVLAFYLEHRSVDRLLAEPPPQSPLGQVLARTTHDWLAAGVRDRLPMGSEKWAARLTHPLAWVPGRFPDFNQWRANARAVVYESLQSSPPAAPFAPRLVAEQDRGSYLARKISFQLTQDHRVLAFVLGPKSPGPHPAVLLLHDHGARFDIGKEKLIEPWDDSAKRIESAREWVTRYYGGRFIGDELARRGYVCVATDMLNWSDRGGGGYDNQQALAANLFQLGASWAGLIAHEDLRAAEFTASLPGVDPKRVAAMGLSVGGFRTWQLAALSDRIAAGVSVCWMATQKGLMVPGNNQTTGQSAFTMLHPGLASKLDYPDVASIACPKPMMFLCGNRDALFPLPAIRDAFDRMREVWESQGAGGRLHTRLYDAPHEFNRAMQEDAFHWLDQTMGDDREP
ncbi:MAG: dienelactone hydrolase family protein [Verrucomicrobiales bacterium]|nr:dienelactone hydrolase family protein [Verrucomicrobiales bacterium]